MLKRDLSRQLLDFIANSAINKSVLLVQGARQVGKTTLVETTLKTVEQEVFSWNLEKDIIFREAIDSCQSFLEFTALLKSRGLFAKPRSILFIDEAQESKRLGSFVRFMKEEWNNCYVILSGSSISKLFNGETRVPVGRVEYLRVTPFTFPEFCQALGKSDALETARDLAWQIPDHLHNDLLLVFDSYLQIGGLPKIVSAHIEGATATELSTLRSEIYISQKDDFQRKEPSLKPELFQNGARAICDLLGMPFALTRISQNHRDARSTLTILSEWLIAYVCEQRTLSPTSAPHAKVYFYDIGLARQLRETTLPSLSMVDTLSPALRTSLGGLIENAIFLMFQQGKGFLNELVGWKKSSKQPIEVDFIWRGQKSTLPLEIKSSLKFDLRRIDSLVKYLHLTEQSLGITISGAPFSIHKVSNVQIINVPVYAISNGELERLERTYTTSNF